MTENTLYKSFKDLKDIILAEKVNILAIIVMFFVFFIVSFNKWGELILFDNAREIVVPFLMSKGLSLYGDIYYFYSPLIPYLFALLIYLFGFHMPIFYTVGILVSFVYSIVLYLIARGFLNRFCSTIVAFLFIIQLVYFNNGIFSYIFPYSYAAIIGSLLVAFLTLLLLLHFHSDNKKYLYFAALCCMFAFLVKQDFFITCTASYVIYFLLIPIKNFDLENFISKENLKTYKNTIYLKELIVSLFFITLIPCLIFAVIGFNVGFSNILHGIVPTELFTMVNPTTQIFCTDVLKCVFTPGNLINLLSYGIGVACFVLSCIIILHFLVSLYKKYGVFKLIIVLLMMVLMFLAVLYFFSAFVLSFLTFLMSNFPNIYSGFNLWLILFIAYYLFNIKNKVNLKLLILGVIALLFNYRMFYGLTLNIYSFYYLPVSMIIFVYTLYSLLPVLVFEKFKLSNETYMRAVTIFLVVYTAGYFFILIGLYNLKSVLVRTHIDTKYTQSFIAPKYKAIKDASDYIIANTTKEDKILVFPSFLIIYLFTDRLPASKYYYLVPGTTTTVEEEQGVINDIKNNKPKYILVHNSKRYYARLGNGEYEMYSFGSKHYYSNILKYIQSNYKVVETFSEDIIYNSQDNENEDEKVIIDIYKINNAD